MAPEQRLAQAVIAKAIQEFTLSRKYAYKVGPLRQLRIAIDAGAFLFERTDVVARHWFALAGIERPSAAVSAKHLARLARLRARQDDLLRRFYRRKAA